MSTLEQAPPSQEQNQNEVSRFKRLKQRFSNFIGSRATAKQTEQPTYKLPTEAEDAAVRQRYAEAGARKIAKEYQDPKSWYNRHVDTSNAYKMAASRAEDEDKINHLNLRTQEEHDSAVQQAKAVMGHTGHSLVGSQEVKDVIHSQALEQADQEGVHIVTREEVEANKAISGSDFDKLASVIGREEAARRVEKYGINSENAATAISLAKNSVEAPRRPHYDDDLDKETDQVRQNHVDSNRQ